MKGGSKARSEAGRNNEGPASIITNKALGDLPEVSHSGFHIASSKRERRLNVSCARRESFSTEVAATSTSYSPSGSARRQLKVPSGRSWIGCPPIVSVASA